MSSVFLSNLEDYIAPSQACVVTTSASSKSNLLLQRQRVIISSTEDSIAIDNSNATIGKSKFEIIKPSTTTKVAKVSLNDCLACSGCVTSAETVLIQQQSYDTFLRELKLQLNFCIVAISPNSLASIAEYIGLSKSQLFLHYATLLKSMGVYYVVDTMSTADISLMETREEFLERYRNIGAVKSRWTRPTTTTAVSSSVVRVFDESKGSEHTEVPVDSVPLEESCLPLLTSNCPGWICFAEKTHPQAIPYLSTAKSPQQILGVLIKKMLLEGKLSSLWNALGSASNSLPSQQKPYVVSIQPCFDKKLEASRLDFFHSASESSEVDLVLSTTEFWQLLVDQTLLSLGETTIAIPPGQVDLDTEDGLHAAIDANAIKADRPGEELNASVVKDFLLRLSPDAVHGRDSIESLFRSFFIRRTSTCDGDSEVCMYAASSNGVAASGGYADTVFRYAAETLFGLDLADKPLPFVLGRNSDIADVDIESCVVEDGGKSDEKVPKKRRLKFGRAYGFRNIQSVILKLKRDKCDLDMIEIMACPSGCNNGGGQLRIAHSDGDSGSRTMDAKERLSRIDNIFHDVEVRKPEDNPLAKYLYCEGRLGQPGSARAKQLLHTRYHAVPKLELIAPLAVKW